MASFVVYNFKNRPLNLECYTIIFQLRFPEILQFFIEGSQDKEKPARKIKFFSFTNRWRMCAKTP